MVKQVRVWRVGRGFKGMGTSGVAERGPGRSGRDRLGDFAGWSLRKTSENFELAGFRGFRAFSATTNKAN